MKKRNYKILAIMVVILCCIGFYLGFSKQEEIAEVVTDNTIETNEIVVTEETKELANETIEATQNSEDLSTTETIESSEIEEQNLEEETLEPDAQVEQENISYDGTNTGNGLSLLGAYQGLTYYSQADSRWANVMYSSVGDASQTMKSSACRTNFGRNCR